MSTHELLMKATESQRPLHVWCAATNLVLARRAVEQGKLTVPDGQDWRKYSNLVVHCVGRDGTRFKLHVGREVH